MTPKEKAEELVERFYMGDDYPVKCGTYCEGGTPDYYGIAKQCALICVDEILSGCCTYVSNKDAKWITDEETSEYWQEVKQEIIQK